MIQRKYAFTVYGGVNYQVYHTPQGRFSKVDCSIPKRVPIPNDTSPENSRRDDSNAGRFGTGTIPTVEISAMDKIGPGCV